MIVMLWIAASMALAPAEAPLDIVKIMPGNVATFDAEGKYVVSPAAALKPGDLALADRAASAGEEAMGANHMRGTVNGEALPIEQGKLSFQMSYNGKNTVLLVRNGLSYRMRYKLIIARGGQVQRTDVCDVATLNRTVENWPYKIDWMGVGALELFDPTDGDVTCQ